MKGKCYEEDVSKKVALYEVIGYFSNFEFVFKSQVKLL